MYNNLGYGFLEKVYENAMVFELKSRGFFVESQKQIKVFYKKHAVGEYFPDLIINEKVISNVLLKKILNDGIRLKPARFTILKPEFTSFFPILNGERDISGPYLLATPERNNNP